MRASWSTGCRRRGTKAQALIINAGGYTHTSVALHDALKTLTIPVVEVHLSNPGNREDFQAQEPGLPGRVRRHRRLRRLWLPPRHRGGGAACRTTEKVGHSWPEKNGKFDTGLIRELAAILREADLGEIEIEQGDLRIRVVEAGRRRPST